MRQLSEEERGKAPPRGVASLPDIREMDQSDDHHHGDMRGVPECSTPTSIKTFKSNANQYVWGEGLFEVLHIGSTG